MNRHLIKLLKLVLLKWVNLKNSISKAITGITNLKETYKLDSEIIAKLTINNNKLNKVLEKLNNFSESIDESVNDIILQESNE